jgi:hypothetical protein
VFWTTQIGPMLLGAFQVGGTMEVLRGSALGSVQRIPEPVISPPVTQHLLRLRLVEVGPDAAAGGGLVHILDRKGTARLDKTNGAGECERRMRTNERMRANGARVRRIAYGLTQVWEAPAIVRSPTPGAIALRSVGARVGVSKQSSGLQRSLTIRCVRCVRHGLRSVVRVNGSAAKCRGERCERSPRQ